MLLTREARPVRPALSFPRAYVLCCAARLLVTGREGRVGFSLGRGSKEKRRSRVAEAVVNLPIDASTGKHWSEHFSPWPNAKLFFLSRVLIVVLFFFSPEMV